MKWPPTLVVLLKKLYIAGNQAIDEINLTLAKKGALTNSIAIPHILLSRTLDKGPGLRIKGEKG